MLITRTFRNIILINIYIPELMHISFPLFKLRSMTGLILAALCTINTSSAYVTSFKTGRLFADRRAVKNSME